MAREFNKLTPLRVIRIKEPGRYSDGLGLYLQVSRFKTKSWLFRYARHGQARQMGLGAVHTVSLLEAREEAKAARNQLLKGIDPIQARRDQRASVRLDAARAMTFEQCAKLYIAAH